MHDKFNISPILIGCERYGNIVYKFNFGGFARFCEGDKELSKLLNVKGLQDESAGIEVESLSRRDPGPLRGSTCPGE